MTRGKVSLAYIAKDSKRKVTFTTRKGGLFKKAHEISTLCGIDACAILFSPYNPEPEIWPSPLKAQEVIAKFRNLSQPEQSRRMVNQESFTNQSVEKIKKKATKKENLNQQNQMTQVMYECLYGKGFEHLSIDDLNYMSGLISQKLWEIQRRIES